MDDTNPFQLFYIFFLSIIVIMALLGFSRIYHNYRAESFCNENGYSYFNKDSKGDSIECCKEVTYIGNTIKNECYYMKYKVKWFELKNWVD